MAGSTMDIRVALVEDHPMVAAGLQALLDGADGIVVVGTATTAGAARELIEAERPQVVCMDHGLPDAKGTDLAREVRTRWPATQVIMLTAVDDDAVLAEAVDAGCAGFVTKGVSDVGELVDTIRCAADGEIALSPSQLARVLPRLRRDALAPGSDLSVREREVLELLAAGMPTRELAEELGISFATARNHIQSLLSKLHAHSKLEAVAVAVRLGLVTYR